MRPIPTNPGSIVYVQELCEADSHKPGIHGSGRIWAKAWDVLRRTSSRGGRRRRAAVAVDFVNVFRVRRDFVLFFFAWNAHGLLLA